MSRFELIAAALLLAAFVWLWRRRHRPEAAAPEDPPEQWDFYPEILGGEPASIVVDLALRDPSARPEAPWLVTIDLDMKDPDDHGMGSAEEVARLGPVEDGLQKLLETNFEGRPVGRIRGGGSWRLFVYLPTTDGVADAVSSFVRNGPGVTCSVRAEQDPAWRVYDSVLAPDEERLRWMLDRRVVDRLEEAGDALDTPRPVDHHLEFPTREARVAFLKAIDGEGFAVTDEAFTNVEPRPYTLSLQRTDPVALEAIHRVVARLQKVAHELGGDYDGWGAPVVTPPRVLH